jgi:hypothetical protein
MPNLTSLSSSLGLNTLPEKTSPIAIQELNENDEPVPDGMLRFQYFPESIADSKAVNWAPKEVPGGSLPLYQWISSGERGISFQAVFTTDVDFSFNNRKATLDRTTALSFSDSNIKRTDESRNIDIRSAVMWLRRFMLPRYGGSVETGTPLTTAPHKLQLYMPGTGIGWAGGAGSNTHTQQDFITAIMTACEVEWVQFFPSGFPRIATVQLAFAQVAQFKGRVEFPAPNGDFDRKVMKGDASGTNSFPYTLRATRTW